MSAPVKYSKLLDFIRSTPHPVRRRILFYMSLYKTISKYMQRISFHIMMVWQRMWLQNCWILHFGHWVTFWNVIKIKEKSIQHFFFNMKRTLTRYKCTRLIYMTPIGSTMNAKLNIKTNGSWLEVEFHWSKYNVCNVFMLLYLKKTNSKQK